MRVLAWCPLADGGVWDGCFCFDYSCWRCHRVADKLVVGCQLKTQKKNHKAQNLIQQKLSFTSSEERKMPFASKTNLHLIKLLSHYHKKFTEPEV